MKDQLYICECNNVEHQMIWRKSPDDSEKIIYVDVHLKPSRLLERIKYAFKYIFGYKSKHGSFDEILLTDKHIENLEEALNYLKQKKE